MSVRWPSRIENTVTVGARLMVLVEAIDQYNAGPTTAWLPDLRLRYDLEP